MAASPFALVQVNAGPFVPTAGGVDIPQGASVAIKLADATDVVHWFLRVTSTDELSTAPTLANVNITTHEVTTPVTVVTFTNSAGAGSAFILESRVQDAFTETTSSFNLYTPTTFGTRVPAAGEEKQANSTFGWATITNPHLRAGALALQGRRVLATAPAIGQFLGFDGTDWGPLTGFTAGNDLSGSGNSQTVIGIQSRPVSTAAPASGEALTWSGTDWAPAAIPPGFTAGGDLTGTPTSQTVSKIQGVAISGTPTVGQFLVATGATAAQWETVIISIDWANPGALGSTTPNLVYATDLDVNGTSTLRGVVSLGFGLPAIRTGSGSPEGVVTAPVGSTYQRTDGPPYFYLKETGVGNTGWAVLLDLSFALTLAGDVTGSSSSNSVAKIQGVAISGTPSAGHGLVATSATTANWAPIVVTVDWANPGALGSTTPNTVRATTLEATGTTDLGTDSSTAVNVKGRLTLGIGAPAILGGIGTPEGVVTAVVGSTYQRTDGPPYFYVKESGTGNTGWGALL